MSDKNKPLFSSKIGLIAATVGSAIGLGNVWRFPAETQANGGAAFLLLYTACALIVGVPVMVAEFSIGRAGRSDAIGSFSKLSPKSPWWIVGVGGILAAYLIVCYYMVVAGWTMEYLFASLDGQLFSGLDAAGADRSVFFTSRMQELVCTPYMPIIFTVLMIINNIFILRAGVQKGIERLSNIMMPILFVILLIMMVVSLSLPGSSEGVEFFLKPDYSKIDARTAVNALGQALFSLSIGMGILITYASYYPADTKLGKTAVTVSLLSVLVAIMMGLIIFPAVTSFGLEGESLRGATLVFVTLPEVFANLPLPWLWAALFFLLLYVAALTSTISISEVPIAMLQDRFGLKRRTAVYTVMLPLLVLSSVCALSFSSMEDIRLFGLTIFELLDTFTTDILLPLVALGTVLYMGWGSPKDLLRDQLSNNGTLRNAMVPWYSFIIKWMAPAAIVAIVVFNYV